MVNIEVVEEMIIELQQVLADIRRIEALRCNGRLSLHERTQLNKMIKVRELERDQISLLLMEEYQGIPVDVVWEDLND